MYPLFAEVFHMRPCDVDALTVAQMNAFTDRLKTLGRLADAG